jgi:hypothetical protein
LLLLHQGAGHLLQWLLPETGENFHEPELISRHTSDDYVFERSGWKMGKLTNFKNAETDRKIQRI